MLGKLEPRIVLATGCGSLEVAHSCRGVSEPGANPAHEQRRVRVLRNGCQQLGELGARLDEAASCGRPIAALCGGFPACTLASGKPVVGGDRLARSVAPGKSVVCGDRLARSVASGKSVVGGDRPACSEAPDKAGGV